MPSSPTPTSRNPNGDPAARAEVREILAALRPSLEKVRALCGQNYLGPEVWREVFGAKAVPAAPPLPRDIMKILQEACPFNAGKKVHETHLLLFVPETLDGTPFNLLTLREKSRAIATRDGKGATFWNQDWYNDKDFAKSPNAKGRWVLVPKDVAPDTRSKNFEQQDSEIKKYTKYETAGALALSTGIILNFLKNGERIYPAGTWGWCADESEPGRRLNVGYFDAAGLDVDVNDVTDSDQLLGRALLRNLAA